MEILYQSTEPIKIAETFGFSWCAFFLFLLAFISIIFIIIGYKKKYSEFVFGGFICFVTALLSAIIILFSKPVYKEVTTYEVRIEEDYPYYELTNKYDIIEQKGEILVIREKGWNEI